MPLSSCVLPTDIVLTFTSWQGSVIVGWAQWKASPATAFQFKIHHCLPFLWFSQDAFSFSVCMSSLIECFYFSSPLSNRNIVRLNWNFYKAYWQSKVILINKTITKNYVLVIPTADPIGLSGVSYSTSCPSSLKSWEFWFISLLCFAVKWQCGNWYSWDDKAVSCTGECVRDSCLKFKVYLRTIR